MPQRQFRLANPPMICVSLLLVLVLAGTPDLGGQQRPRLQPLVGVYGGTGNSTVDEAIEQAKAALAA